MRVETFSFAIKIPTNRTNLIKESITYDEAQGMSQGTRGQQCRASWERLGLRTRKPSGNQLVLRDSLRPAAEAESSAQHIAGSL